ncbi:hypothetical protein AB6A40_005594 [Gnathostoma spinigerum]|uniref:TAR DNA-binding protein 43 N-terminal domain-containing protein n=1 Tax=Gnathostoma spinigerum TaxID=75299 RepID=A0ABD6ERJ0_9BILA
MDGPSNTVATNQIEWVRLQLEPLEVPTEDDGTLLLSTVQSAIPGAHGVYYCENGVKRFLRYNYETGRFNKLPAGWRNHELYVTLAHNCCRPGSRIGGPYGQYIGATKLFGKTVSSVQRLLAQTGMGMHRATRQQGTGEAVQDSRQPTDGGRHEEHRAMCEELGVPVELPAEEFTEGIDEIDSIGSSIISDDGIDQLKLRRVNDSFNIDYIRLFLYRFN